MSRNPSSITSSKSDASQRQPRDTSGQQPRRKNEPAADGGWFVYIVRCRDGTLYTGVTTDLDRRVQQHNDGTGARYTRSRRPVRLVHAEPCHNRGDALRRELAIKALSRDEKQLLIAGR
ncbi:MAG TPA: GIY-YIG nuclease family protein [Candidatus Ozemobacteraceae bacterium]